ncbi:MAG: hypothetical protein PUG85_00670 [Oscillospiraceae bacterium]|nr:hypothetical protein [Oscillospiraceae bacterium]
MYLYQALLQNLRFCNTGNPLPVVALPPRAAVHIVLTKADGFAAAFGGIANNSVACNRGQYI